MTKEKASPYPTLLSSGAGGGEGLGLYLSPQFNVCGKCDEWHCLECREFRPPEYFGPDICSECW